MNHQKSASFPISEINETNILLRIKMIENLISKTQELVDEADNVTKLFNIGLPQIREAAYPSDKTESTVEMKIKFKEYIDDLGTSKKIHRERLAEIEPLRKTISALNYVLYQIKEATNPHFKILVIDLEDISVKPNISVAAFGDNQTEVLLGDCPLSDLAYNIEHADKVITFAREDAIEELNTLGFNVSKEDKKFTSIHHLMRPFSDFQRLGLTDYTDMLQLEQTDDNAYNLISLYANIVGIDLEPEIVNIPAANNIAYDGSY